MDISCIHRREFCPNAEFLNEIHPLLKRIFLARGIRSDEELQKNLINILPFYLLKNIDKACDLLFDTLENQQKIIIVGDFDTDGATSTALALLALKEFGFKNVDYIIPNRFKNGYGLTNQVVLNAQEKKADLIFTVDNGISSFDAIDLANELNIKTLITDHHLAPISIPNANVIINPNQNDCFFSSKSIAGVGVTFYVFLAFRAYLREKNWFSQNNINEPNLAKYLDLVAFGTIADVVPLDLNNRILVHQGLNRIRAKKCRIGILALIEIAKKNPEKLSSTDLGFSLAPRLNAAGRLDEMAIGVELLLTEDKKIAQNLAKKLDNLNQERKSIESDMKNEAIQICETIDSNEFNKNPVIILYQPHWHSGVLGILASRIKEKFHRPVIAFAEESEGILKGSCRSISSFHIRKALELFNLENPNLILHFGGHAAAAGLSINKHHFLEFKQKANDFFKNILDLTLINPQIFTDGELKNDYFSIEHAELIQKNGPWGTDFPEPSFDGKFQILKQQLIGENHLKINIKPINEEIQLEAICFNVDRKIWPNPQIKFVHLVYRLDVNEYNQCKKLQLIIEHIFQTE